MTAIQEIINNLNWLGGKEFSTPIQNWDQNYNYLRLHENV